MFFLTDICIYITFFLNDLFFFITFARYLFKTSITKDQNHDKMETTRIKYLAFALMMATTVSISGQTMAGKLETLCLTLFEDTTDKAYEWTLKLNDNDTYTLRIDTIWGVIREPHFIQSARGEFDKEIADGAIKTLNAGNFQTLVGTERNQIKIMKKVEKKPTADDPSWTLTAKYTDSEELKAGGESLKGKKFKVVKDLKAYLEGYQKEMEVQNAKRLEEERLHPQGLDKLPDCRIKYVSYSYNGGMINLQINWTVLYNKEGKHVVEYKYHNGRENISESFTCEEDLNEVLRPIFEEGEIVKYKRNYDETDLHALDEPSWSFSVKFIDDTWVMSSGRSTNPEDDSAIKRTDEYLRSLAIKYSENKDNQ